MTMRTRKLIGTVLMLLLIFIYTLLAMSVGVAILPGAAWYTEAAYYAVAGLAWVPLAGLLINWMSRPDPDPEH